ncbi:MAG: sensor histidine kinase [Gammaproteobacteria bacterium]|nr:sensor histidine kinase [Gammaproteobacteria bacterium]MBU1441102.1 sensor histidine kinase [Gammaproteobacteria bacterium]MBU2288557.1 sensor histidine kinase [Gammaproteobacteria bacterium]
MSPTHPDRDDPSAPGARLAGCAPHESADPLQARIEQERAAIAREVHDEIGGALSAIHYDLAWIERHGDDAGVLSHVRAALATLKDAMGTTNRIVQDLRPPILDQGLVPAVQWLAGDFERRTGVVTEFSTTRESIELPAAVQLVAYRTAQEALTNIRKHADCSKVSIDLSDRRDVLTLEVSDNGRGLHADAIDPRRSFGLRGLGERARTVGGWLDVSTRPGGGTSIILSVPMERAP